MSRRPLTPTRALSLLAMLAVAAGIAYLQIVGAKAPPVAGKPKGHFPPAISVLASPAPWPGIISVPPGTVRTATPTPAIARRTPSTVWPGPANTGVRGGRALTPRSGRLVLNRNGQVLDSVSLTGCISVTASNVTIKNSRIRGLGGCFAGIRTDGGRNLLIEDTEIDGLNQDATAYGVAQQDGGYTCLRCNVHGVGVAYTANGTGPVSIRDSWGWGLHSDPASHNQDFLSNGTTSGVTLIHDRFDNPLDQTATISLFGDFSPIQNVTVEDNLLNGGDFCLYAGHDPDKPYGTQDQNIHVIANHFMRTPELGAFYPKCAQFGAVTAFNSTSPGNVWSGNVWDDNGAPVLPSG